LPTIQSGAGCSAVSRPQNGPDRRSPKTVGETCGRGCRRGRETCAEQRFGILAITHKPGYHLKLQKKKGELRCAW